jgi:colanic acid biosynthesis glycosyl transferase WcaI
MPLKGRGVAVRIAGWLWFHLLSVVAAWLKVHTVDVILAPSPPLSIGVAAWIIGLVKRAPFVYTVQELYPDTAVRLGALRDGVFLKLLHRVEAFVYDRSFAVTTIAPSMARTIGERTSNPCKVRLIPNFVDTRVMVPRSRENEFAREFDLIHRFTVVYAGNMGPAQGLKTLLDAAELTRDNHKIVYVLVGEGTSRASLVRSAQTRELSNVLFIPQQPYARVPDIYGASDLCVVPLTSSLVSEAVPSKVYRIMAAERRVLAITDGDSDLARLVKESRTGIVVEAGNPRALARAIIDAATKADGTSAKRGREYVVQHVDRPKIVGLYAHLLSEAVTEGAVKRGR